jgi:hypothetical protein
MGKKWEKIYFWGGGGGETNLLLECSKAMPARPSDMERMRVGKTIFENSVRTAKKTTRLYDNDRLVNAV